jgi:hypothetical protein
MQGADDDAVGADVLRRIIGSDRVGEAVKAGFCRRIGHCAGAAHQPKGAALDDPTELFNASLEGGTRRAIDFHEGDTIDEKALKALIRAAVALNTSTGKPARGTKKKK